MAASASRRVRVLRPAVDAEAAGPFGHGGGDARVAGHLHAARALGRLVELVQRADLASDAAALEVAEPPLGYALCNVLAAVPRTARAARATAVLLLARLAAARLPAEA